MSGIRLACWNVNSIKVRLPHVLSWLNQHAQSENPIDALCLQELKLTNENYPMQAFEDAGYISLVAGQKTYNGVAILVRRSALAGIATDHQSTFLSPTINNPLYADEQMRLVSSTISFHGHEPIRIISAYFPNGQEPGSDKFIYKLTWLAHLREWLAIELKKYPRLALLGDFNIAPDDEDVHDPSKWIGQNLVSAEERQAFKDLISLGLVDVFRSFPQEPKLYSWWDYRMFAYKRNAGLRIDHILLSESLSKSCTACKIDKVPRGWEQPSDHAPVIADLSAETAVS